MEGDNQNRIMFYELNGIKRFSNIILNEQDLKFVEMCSHAIMEVLQYKEIAIKLLANKEETEMLKQVILLCL
jgi:hypothetical protein